MKKLVLVCLCLGVIGSAFGETNTEPKGLWGNSVDSDPINDVKTYSAYLPSPTEKSRWGKPIYLAITCSNNVTKFYISWETFINTESHQVTIRLDDQKAFTRTWNPSNDNEASFYSGSPIPFLKKLINAKKMVARVSPYNENDITVTFNLTGINTALENIRKQCKW